VDFLSVAQQINFDQGCLIVEVSRSHTHTHTQNRYNSSGLVISSS